MTGSSSLCKYSTAVALSCFIGLLLSIYSLYVELQTEQNDNYEALCDISEHMSCSKVFSSEYGRGFGIIGWIFGEQSILSQPNGVYGIIFYILVAVLGFSTKIEISTVVIVMCAMSNVMSLYLAYILYFILEDFCVVCVSTYFVNVAVLLLSINRHHIILQERLSVRYKKFN